MNLTGRKDGITVSNSHGRDCHKNRSLGQHLSLNVSQENEAIYLNELTVSESLKTCFEKQMIIW